jgi:transposase
VSDYKGCDLVMHAEAPAPKVLLVDRAYHSGHIRADFEGGDAGPVSPGRRSRRALIPIDEFVYAIRNRVECIINKLKCSRRLATRYEKTRENYLGFIHLTSVRLWIRHIVNRA